MTTYYTYNGKRYILKDGLYFKVTEDAIITDNTQPVVELASDPEQIVELTSDPEQVVEPEKKEYVPYTPVLYAPYTIDTNPEGDILVKVKPDQVVPVPVVVVPVVVVPVVPVPVVPVDARKKNELNITKVITITLLNFDIKIIRVSPNCCCAVDIVINTSTGQVERTVNLTSDDYSKWGTNDDYIYYYIRDNIDKIY
jgi:hypothetical protein